MNVLSFKLGAAAGQVAGNMAANWINSNPAMRAGIGAFKAMTGGGFEKALGQTGGMGGMGGMAGSMPSMAGMSG